MQPDPAGDCASQLRIRSSPTGSSRKTSTPADTEETQRHKAAPSFLTRRNFELTNICCFKPLHLGGIWGLYTIFAHFHPSVFSNPPSHFLLLALSLSVPFPTPAFFFLFLGGNNLKASLFHRLL